MRGNHLRTFTKAGFALCAFWTCTLLSAGAATTNWVAYNDHTPGTTAGWATAPNSTRYNMRGVAGGNAGTVLSGPLTNFDSGAQLTAVFTSSRLNADPDDFGSMSYPNAGTPAYVLFNGKVDLGNTQSGIGTRASSGSQSRLTFSNLDPSKTYVFRGTSVRGGSGGTYAARWSLVTLEGADSSTDAHTAGVYTSATFPSGTMTAGQAAYNSGVNLTGEVVGWDAINPGADGTFSVRCQQYVDNPLPNGMAPASEYGYGICAFMLAEVETGPAVAPMITVQPVGGTFPERTAVSLSVVASGTGLSYQWYREPATPIAGATLPNYSPTNHLGDSRYPWSTPADNGTYYVVVSGTVAPPAESTHVAVTVTPDTTAPTMVRAVCGPGPDDITLTMSEPMNNADLHFTDEFLWEIAATDGSGTLNLSGDGVYADDGVSRTITFTLLPPGRDVTKGYKITRLPGDLASDTARTANTLAPNSSVPLLCFTNKVINLGQSWKYNDQDVDPGPTWANVGFDDSTGPWLSGPGPFDGKRDGGIVGPDGLDDCRAMTFYNLGTVGTCIRMQSPVTLTNLTTAYFRTHFNWAGSTAGAFLHLNGKFDDGAIVYLNGTEVARTRVAAGTIPHTAYSGSGTTVGDGDPQDVFDLSSPAALVSGDNVLAVELKQGNNTSSDLTMGLELSYLTGDPPITLTIIDNGNGTVNVSWTPVAGTLKSSTNIAAPRSTWTTVGTTSPQTVTKTGTQKFFIISVP